MSEVRGPNVRQSEESMSFPYFLKGKVVRGFQRGTNELGIPTANLDGEEIKCLKLNDGVYYGWAKVMNDPTKPNVYGMCASIGLNPTYGNVNRSLEVHLMDKIDGDLYDKQIRVIFIGFIRPQLELKTIDELKKVIQNDIEQSTKALENSSAKELKTHNYFN